MTNIQLARHLAGSPRRFFAALLEWPRYALPMWLILLGACAIIAWFYSIANVELLMEQQLTANPQAAAMTEAQRAQTVRFMTRGVQLSIGICTTLFFVLLVRLLESLYYKLVGNATGHRRTYRQWFAFAWWTSVPGLIGVVSSMLLLATAAGSPTDLGLLQPLSFNSLYFHREIGEPGYQVLSSLSVLMFLSVALVAYGQKCWSGRSWLYAVLVSATPLVLFGGGALWYVLGRS